MIGEIIALSIYFSWHLFTLISAIGYELFRYSRSDKYDDSIVIQILFVLLSIIPIIGPMIVTLEFSMEEKWNRASLGWKWLAKQINIDYITLFLPVVCLGVVWLI